MIERNYFMRIISNYSPTESADIQKAAKELSISLAALQKYCVLLFIKQDVPRNNTHSMPHLLSIMHRRLNQLPNGSTFIVSSLFSSRIWTNLSRADKTTLAKHLADYIKLNPSTFVILSNKRRGTINRYKKM